MSLEAVSSRCPVCRAAIAAPAEQACGTFQCPRCEARLWFVQAFTTIFIIQRPGIPLSEELTKRLGAPAAADVSSLLDMMEGPQADSMDRIELLTEFEAYLKK